MNARRPHYTLSGVCVCAHTSEAFHNADKAHANEAGRQHQQRHRKRSVFMSVATALIAGQCTKMMINIFNSTFSFFSVLYIGGINFVAIALEFS